MKLSFVKEVCLYISDLEEAKAFYHGKLGLPVISMVEGRHIFFRSGITVLLCFLPEVTAKETRFPAHYAHGKQHLAFEVTEYEKWVARLPEVGIPITHTHSWSADFESIYFEDPFGHVLELVQPGMWDPT